MTRKSFIGPLLLIAAGVIFLINNIRPELSVLRIVGEYWPLALIGWGVIRLAEITAWHFSGKTVPRTGISGGEWVVIALLCFLGSSAFYVHRNRDRWGEARINMHGLEIFGDSFDFTLPEQKAAVGKTPRIIIENFRGNARINGVDGEEVKVTGRSAIRSYSQPEADKVNTDCKLQIVHEGGVTIIRSNQDKAPSSARISTDLEIAAPRGASIEGRGRFGDFDVSDFEGTVSIDSDNAGVRLSNIGGNVKVDTRKSDIVRAAAVKGNVEVRGGGHDVELDSIQGQSLVSGNYVGELTFRSLARQVRLTMPNTEFRAEKIQGRVSNTRGEITGNDVAGPIVIKAKSKDVQLTDFSQAIDVSVDRGDLEIRPGKTPLSKMDLHTRGGNISLALPAGANFDLKASSERGPVENDYGDPLKQSGQGKSSRLEGKVGVGGPEISLTTERGRLSVRKGGAGVPVPPAPPAAPVPPVPGAPKTIKAPSVTSL